MDPSSESYGAFTWGRAGNHSRMRRQTSQVLGLPCDSLAGVPFLVATCGSLKFRAELSGSTIAPTKSWRRGPQHADHQRRVLHQIPHDRVVVGRWGLLGVLRSSRNMAPIRMTRALGDCDVAVVCRAMLRHPRHTADREMPFEFLSICYSTAGSPFSCYHIPILALPSSVCAR